MSALQKRYRVRGLGIEKLLETLQEQGVVLYDITRAGSRAVSFACDLAQSSHVEETAQALGFSLEALPPKGMLHWLLNMRSQAGLWVLALLRCEYLSRRSAGIAPGGGDPSGAIPCVGKHVCTL